MDGCTDPSARGRKQEHMVMANMWGLVKDTKCVTVGVCCFLPIPLLYCSLVSCSPNIHGVCFR